MRCSGLLPNSSVRGEDQLATRSGTSLGDSLRAHVGVHTFRPSVRSAKGSKSRKIVGQSGQEANKKCLARSRETDATNNHVDRAMIGCRAAVLVDRQPPLIPADLIEGILLPIELKTGILESCESERSATHELGAVRRRRSACVRNSRVVLFATRYKIYCLFTEQPIIASAMHSV